MKHSRISKPGKVLRSGTVSCRLQDSTLVISGSLRISGSAGFVKTIIKEIAHIETNVTAINIDELEDIDSAGVITLFYLKEKLTRKSREISIEGGNSSIREKISLFAPDTTKKEETPTKPGLAEAIGTGAHRFFKEYVFGFTVLAADVFYWSVADLFRKKSRRKGEFSKQALKIGANAAMIVVFMSFAIGLVLAVQSGGQLKTFGANIYIVDLTVIAIMSQMGPLITAILVAGRSGSSIAAEIATMKVTSELDALKTMGLDPVRFVVVPKLYAALFTLPFLIILANVAGIAGGAVAAYYNLDITPEIFFNRMGSIMKNKDLLTGFVKSQVYASIIVLTGSFYGFSVERGAEGVGRVTTHAVVVAISLVVLADSAMGLIFY